MARIKSGTDEARELIRSFGITFYDKTGVDLGFGGDSISEFTINVDLPKPYTNVGDAPQHIHCDARKLSMFNDDSLDYVYSSHLLEDFPNTEDILEEWIRVLKVGGLLILVLPNEKKYRAYCQARREGRNMHHSIEDMSIEYMTNILSGMNVLITEACDCGEYSFIIIAKKLS